jgi:uncharacterized membrane protein YdfJ with MMPL/SSD domain
MTALARLAVGRPWRIVIAVVALTILGFGFFGLVSTRLSNGLSDYDDPASLGAQARAQVQHATGIDLEEGYSLLVKTNSPVSLTSTPPAIVAEVVALLHTRPEVVTVADAWSAQVPSLIADNGRSVLVVAALRPLDEASAVNALQASIDANPALRGNVLLGGPTAIGVQGAAVNAKNLSFAETIALPILILLLLLIFRGVVAAMLPLLGALVSIAVTSLGLLAATGITQVSVYALNLVFALGLGLSIDFSLLIVSRYREEMHVHGPGFTAIRRTLMTAGKTVLFSATTVTAALGCLLLFPIPALSSMGIAGMMVTVSAAFAAVVMLPAVLVLLGHRVDALAPKRLRGAVAGSDAGWWAHFAHAVMRRAALVGALVVVAMLIIALPLLGIKFTGYDTSGLPASLPASQVNAALTTEFTGVSAAPLQLIIQAGPSATTEVASYAASVGHVPGVLAVAPPTAIGSTLWEVDATLAGSTLSPEAQTAVAQVAQVPAPFPVRATGYTAEFTQYQSSLTSHLPLVVILLAITTLLILFAMTGSVVLPVMALVMSALTLAATFGILVLVFQNGFLSGFLGFHSEGAIDSTPLVITGALAIGLSTDYGVLLLSRIREGYLTGLSTRDAVAFGLQRVGRVVTSAAVLFCIAVGALVLSQTTALKAIGLGAALAVLIDATLVRALLVPALMALLGRTSWWAPAPLTALHKRLGLDGLEGADTPEPAPLVSTTIAGRRAGSVAAVGTPTPVAEPTDVAVVK